MATKVTGRLGRGILNIDEMQVDGREHTVHCKKRLAVFPSPAGMSLSARESLVSNILAGDEKTANFFYTVTGDRRMLT
jgi:hypothetical protein